MQITIAYLANTELDYTDVGLCLCRPMDTLCKLYQVTHVD